MLQMVASANQLNVMEYLIVEAKIDIDYQDYVS